MKNKLRYKLFFGCILFLTAGMITAQNYSASETLSKSIVVPEELKIVLSNKSADLVFKTGSENMVTVNTEIKIDGRSEEDVQKVIDAVKDFRFDLHGDKLEVDTRFYKNFITIGFRSTMTLLNGEKARVRDIDVSHEFTVPASVSLEIENKYSEIEMENIGGEAELNLYDTKLYSGDIGGDLKLNLKYSKVEMGSAGEVEADIYDSDVVLKSCGNLKVESKYSKFETKADGRVVIDSYDDKFKLSSLTEISAEAKYSDFEIDSDLNSLDLDFYDCNLTAGNITDAVFRGKYSELIFNSVKYLKIPESYDNKFDLGNAKKVEVTESKYTDYFAGKVESFLLNGYDDNIKISGLNSGFGGPVKVDGKYIKLEIDSGNEPYQFDFDIKYPNIDIPENVDIIRQIEDNSNLKLVGNDTGGKIIVTGYDMAVKIR